MKLYFKTAILYLIVIAETAVSQPYEVHKGALKTNVSDNRLQGSLSDFDLLHYSLDLRFPFTSSQLDGKVVLTVRSSRNGLSEIALNSVNLNIDSVSVFKNTVTWSLANDLIQIRLNREYASGDTFSVRIVYHGAPEERGFYFYPMCAYTFSEPEDARAWFPCRDVPWDKATADIRVTVPAGVKVASIGLLTSRMPSADGQWETFHWETRHQVATYLMCVTMSRHYSRWSDWYVTDDKDSIEMVNYIFQRDSAKAVQDLVHLKDAVAFFSMQFGPYPFEKFGVAEVEPFRYGGMEHQTLVTFNSVWIQGDRRYESSFVHELSHMWWGDAVTLADWPDIWLNEGFAMYCEALFAEFYYGAEAFQGKLREMKRDYLEQAGKKDFPIFDPPEGELFNGGIVYGKAGLVLHMLRRVAGEENFWRILREYYKTFCYRNASTSDFQGICERFFGNRLDWFFQEWIYQSGFPQIAYSYSDQPLNSGGVKITLRIQQIQKSGVLFRMPIDVRLAGVKDTVVQVESALERFVFTVNRRPDSLVLDPDGWLLMHATPLPDGIRETGGIPDGFALYPTFPNPFNAEATVYYDIPDVPEVSRVTLVVYNILGKPVRVLLDTNRPVSGRYEKLWDGKDAAGKPLSSGIYIFKLTAGSFAQEQKAVLTK